MPSKSKSKAKSTPAPASPAVEAVPEPALVGHSDVLDLFRQVISRGRLGHAYLFVGPEGIGKKRLARYLAQTLLCETVSPSLVAPCGQCAGCAQVMANSHPDLMQVRRPDDRNELPISVIQELVSQLSLRPARGKAKVGIVDDADDLNEESANCFLKTLEEPPPGSVLILIASSIDTQLPTIQSRCQLVRLRELQTDDVVRLLGELKVPADQAEAERLARRSEGSIGRAIEMAQPAWKEIESLLIQSLSKQPIPTTTLSENLLKFIEDAGKDSASKRIRAHKIVSLTSQHLRDALREAVGGEACSALTATARSLDPDVIADMIDRSLEADYHIARMAALPLLIETWIDDLGRIASGKYLAPIR
ncbi:DNA polymerase III subunit delta' [bacterium]|nr:DNA polymerase III subunit delta' [bacterium]